MGEFTRKAYLELYKDGMPVVAQGRNSNRHTSLVEAGEHADEHAREVRLEGTYEIRVGGGVYYTVKISEIVLDHTISPPATAGQADFALSASSYSGRETTVIQFTILRTEDTTERLSVDWSITNANVTPANATLVFEAGVTQEVVSVTAGSIGPTEVGTLIISNPVNLDGGTAPAIISPSSASFTVYDNPSIDAIPDFDVNVGSTYNLGQYINDPGGFITTSQVLNITASATYSHATKLLTGVTADTITGLQLEVTSVAGVVPSNTFNITIQEAGVAQSWAQRSTASGVLQAINFAAQSQIDAIDDNRLTRVSTDPDWDRAGAEQTIKVSGNYSLRQTIRDADGAQSSADWGFDFAEVVGDGTRPPDGTPPPGLPNPVPMFGLQTGGAEDYGNEMYIQWRQYWPQQSLDIVWDWASGRGGWKVLKVINGDYWDSGGLVEHGSSSRKELTHNNVQVSNMIGVGTGTSANTKLSVNRNTNGQTWTDQFGREHEGDGEDGIHQNAFGTSSTLSEQASERSTRTTDLGCGNSFGCNAGDSHQITWGGTKKHPFRGQDDKVFEFYPDEWLTFKIHVTLGTRSGGYWVDSVYRLYGQRDGGALIPIINYTIDLEHFDTKASGGTDPNIPDNQQGYGKMFFTPFMTALNSQTGARATYNTYIDEIIVSKEDIADTPAASTEVTPDSTALGQLAQSMSVGSWEQLPATFPPDASTFFTDDSGGIFDFAHQGHWDESRQKLFIFGAAYGDGCVVTYDAAADTWTRDEPVNFNPIHGWDHSAYDEQRGELYVGRQTFNGGGKYRIDADNVGSAGSWTSLPNGSNSSDTYGACWWPSLDSYMAFLGNEAGDTGAIYRLPRDGSWTSFASNPPGWDRGLHTFADHNPVRDVMYFGGGNTLSTAFYEVNASGTITALDNCPITLNIAGGSGQHGKVAIEKTTGNVIVMEAGGTDMAEYVHGSGWQSISTTLPSFLQNNLDVVSIPVRIAGTSLLVYVGHTQVRSSGQVWVYRYL